MKECPRCHQTYGDNADFCSTHGVALVPVASAPREPAATGQRGNGLPIVIGASVLAAAAVIVSLVVSRDSPRPKAAADSTLAIALQSAERATRGFSDTTVSAGNPAPLPLLAKPAVDQRAVDREEIIRALRRADRAEVEALRTLSEEPLDDAFTGAALATDVERVRRDRRTGAYDENTLLDFSLRSFAVLPGRTRARAEVVESWTTTRRSTATNECLSRTPRHEAPQTVFLVRRESSWLVDSIAFGATDGLTSDPCSGVAGGWLRIQNDSRFAIERIYMSATNQSQWGPDQLGTNVLRPGTSFTLTSVSAGRYDLRFIDEDGDRCVLRNVSIDGRTSWTLTSAWLARCEGY